MSLLWASMARMTWSGEAALGCEGMLQEQWLAEGGACVAMLHAILQYAAAMVRWDATEGLQGGAGALGSFPADSCFKGTKGSAQGVLPKGLHEAHLAQPIQLVQGPWVTSPESLQYVKHNWSHPDMCQPSGHLQAPRTSLKPLFLLSCSPAATLSWRGCMPRTQLWQSIPRSLPLR